MKKVLFILGALCLLFGLSFLCSYGIYKKSNAYTDTSERSVSTRETVETITKQGNGTTASTESSEKTEEEAVDGYKYLVSSLNGYVAVFTSSGSLYEFTDIKLSDLQSDVKERILNGIKFQKEKELFTFLESCSS